MIKNIFLDAGGVILDESFHETKRAEIITSLLNSINPDYLLKDYQNDAEDAVYRFILNIYNYIIYKNSPNENIFRKLCIEYNETWQNQKPDLVLMRHQYSLLLSLLYLDH